MLAVKRMIMGPIASVMTRTGGEGARIPRMPAIVKRAYGDKCKKPGSDSKKKGIVCQPPKLDDKPIPPYDYGYCKEYPPPPLMSCPPKPKRSKKGPCCHKSDDKKKGGCKGR